MVMNDVVIGREEVTCSQLRPTRLLDFQTDRGQVVDLCT
jgi:hypothetical protein